MRIEQGSSGSDSPSSIKKYFLCEQHKPPGAKPFMSMYENDEDGNDAAAAGDGSGGRKCKKRVGRYIDGACDIDEDEDDGYYLDDNDEEFVLAGRSKKGKNARDNDHSKQNKKLNKNLKESDTVTGKCKSRNKGGSKSKTTNNNIIINNCTNLNNNSNNFSDDNDVTNSKNKSSKSKAATHSTIVNPHKLQLPDISTKVSVLETQTN